MKRYLKGLIKVFAVAFLFSAASISAQDKKDDKSKKDIVDTAVAAGQFTTLAKALQTAGLVEVLKGSDKYTVFAPTDAAFAKLPARTLEELLKPENKDKLRALLLYHVVKGKVESRDVVKLNGKEVAIVQGSKVKIDTTDGVKVNSATVVTANVIASNGVIHIIDTVLMPTN